MKRIIQVEIEGHIAYKKRLTFDWPQDEIVALVGTIGAGKSTLMGIPAMVFYNYNPDRPDESLYDSFPEMVKQGYLSCTIETEKGIIKGERILNIKSRTMDVHLYKMKDDGTFSDLGTEGKESFFKELISNYIGMSKELFCSTLYHAQSKESHPENASDKERSSLMYELMPQLIEFRNNFQIIDKERLKVSKEVDDLKKQKQIISSNNDKDFSEYPGTIKSEKVRLDSLKENKKTIDSEYQEINTQYARVQEIINTYDDRIKEIERLESLIDQDNNLSKETTDIIANNQKYLIDRKDIIEKAHNELIAVESEIKTLNDSINAKNKRIDKLQSTLDQDRKDAKLTNDELRKSLSEKQIKLEAKRKEKESLENVISSIEIKLEAQKQYSEKIESVPCNDKLQSSCSLFQEVFLSAKESDLLRESIHAKKKELERIDLSMYQSSYDDVNKQIESIDKGLEDREKEFQSEKTLIQKSITQIQNEIKEKDESKATLEKDAKFYDRLQNAETRVNELKSTLESCNERLKNNNERIKELQSKSKDIESEKDELSKLETKKNEIKKSIDTIESEISEIAKTITILETELRDYESSKEKLILIQKQIDEKTDYLSDLILLKEANSDKGAPALIMKSAGPEISSIANSILPEGVKFSIDVTTEKYVKSRKEYVEHIDFAAVDNETGMVKPIKYKSGGESSIASEALSLAMAIYNKRKNDVSMEVLFRDETAGNLDSESKLTYIKMLKNVMELGGFKQLNYIVHDDSLTEIANCVIGVNKGSVKIYDDVYDFRGNL